MKPRLLVATGNTKKADEIVALLLGHSVAIETLASWPTIGVAAETGQTFRENALKKAEFACEATGLASLADDSGLCVDALGGRPGVLSHRYAEGSDGDRVRKLLNEMHHIPWEDRTARFVAGVAFVAPGIEPAYVEGSVLGRIALAPRGTAGFGYDPIFFVDSLGRTMAELSPDEKNAISHRGHALRAIRPALLSYFSLEVDSPNP